MTFIYLCIHLCCQVIMRILELPLADQLHPGGFNSSSQIFMGKERKPPQTIFWSFVQADIEKENTYRELHFCTTLVKNTHKQPWDTTIYRKQKTKASTTKTLPSKKPNGSWTRTSLNKEVLFRGRKILHSSRCCCWRHYESQKTIIPQQLGPEI